MKTNVVVMPESVRSRVVRSKNAPETSSLDQVLSSQDNRRQDSVHQFVLRQPFGLRSRPQIFVRDMKVAVPQVVADRELMFAHLRQHGSNRVLKSVPAYTRDSIRLNAG